MMGNRRATPSSKGGYLSRFAGTVHDDPVFILAENRMRHEARWAYRGVGLRLVARSSKHIPFLHGYIPASAGRWQPIRPKNSH